MTFFWANCLILLRTTSIPLVRSSLEPEEICGKRTARRMRSIPKHLPCRHPQVTDERDNVCSLFFQSQATPVRMRTKKPTLQVDETH